MQVLRRFSSGLCVCVCVCFAALCLSNQGWVGTFGGIPSYIPNPEPARQLKNAEEVGVLTWAPNQTGKPPRPVNTVMLNKTNIRRLVRRRPQSARPARRTGVSTHSSKSSALRK